jgi:hypothetical protein
MLQLNLNSTRTIQRLSILLLALSFYGTTFAQYSFLPNPEIKRQGSQSTMGIDLLETGSEKMKVYSTPIGIAWEYQKIYTLSGIGDRGIEARQSDVVLVKYSGTFYALEVLYDARNQNMSLITWQFDPNGEGKFFVAYSPLILASGTQFSRYNRITIDANSNNDFAIVWEDNNSNINYYVDNFLPGTSNMPLTGSLTSGQYPDVAITESSVAGTATVYCAYISNQNFNTLKLTSATMDLNNTVFNISASPQVIDSEPNNMSISQWPSFACPNVIDQPNNWTIVYTKTSSGVFNVHGVTMLQGFTHAHVYSSAGIMEHRMPVVCYSNETDVNYLKIFVSWTAVVDGYSYQNTIVSVYCDEKGDMEYRGGNYHVIVPKEYSYYIQTMAPVAGRHCSSAEICFQSNEELISKELSWSGGSRTEGKGDDHEKIRFMYGKPAIDLSTLDQQKKFSLMITDISGRVMLSCQGNANYLTQKALSNIISARPGAYVITIFQKNKIIQTSKINKQ